MSNPKKHHFVPVWYLKEFADKTTKALCVFDKQKNEWRTQKPKNVMCINKYYKQDWVPTGVDHNILEKMLGNKIEPEAKAAFNRLINTRGKISEDDIIAIVVYLDFQKIRTYKEGQKAKKLIKEQVTRFALRIPEIAPVILNKKVEINIKDQVRFDYMRILSGLHMRYFLNMHWNIIKSEKGNSFITTDNPVTLINYEQPPLLETGIGLAGTSVLFPITPSYLLIMTHHSTNEMPSLFPIPKPEIGASKISFQFSKCSSKQVKAFNYFLYLNTYRYVVSDKRTNLTELIQK